MQINDDYIINLFFVSGGIPSETLNINYVKQLKTEKYKDILEYLNTRYSDSDSIAETLYRIKYNIENRPVCKYCGGHVKYKNKITWYGHCSTSCSSKDPAVQLKLKETKKKYYGDENYCNTEKFKKTCLEKYGTTSPLLHEKIKEKTRKTCLEKYNSPVFTNNEKAKQTKYLRYGDENYNNFKKAKITKYLKYGDENYSNRDKFKQTCLEKYGVTTSLQSKEIQNKSKNTCLEKYGETYYVKSDIFKIKQRLSFDKIYSNPAICQEIQDKCKQTSINKYGYATSFSDASFLNIAKEKMIEKYGVDNYWKTKECIIKSHNEDSMKKRNETKRKNKTFNTSIPENTSYELLKETFPDVICQYSDDKYPFLCDFYIPSMYMYIECNYHWTHGGKPFENTLNDNKKLNKWKEKNTKYYNNAINVWTNKDVHKRNVAHKNELNYKEFWNINELKEFLNSQII